MDEASQPWAVFVTGSRDLEWVAHHDLIYDKLVPYMSYGSALIHGMGKGRTPGGCGCDRIAAHAAATIGLRVLGFPALWTQQGNPAGPIRNTLCAEVLLAMGRAGYRLACLAFSTGGPGTEGAYREVSKQSQKSGQVVLMEKIDIQL